MNLPFLGMQKMHHCNSIRTLFIIGALLLNVLFSQTALASRHINNALSCRPTDISANASGTANGVIALPDSRSLLIVLLDRSACMGLHGSGADPSNYSASITDVFSDLWPGPMAVITFQSDTVMTIGPYPPSVRADLKSRINEVQSNGDAPLELAMSSAQSLLRRQNYPKGSRIVLITAASEVMGQQDALNTDLSAFAQEGVPVSTLWMLSSSNAGQAAQPFLQGIAQQTGGSFVRVGNAADMAQAVRTFCQMNCGLKFEPLEYNPVGHDYITTLDDTARYFALLTFYETGTTGNVLGIAGREIPPQAVITSLDNKHYELDTLHLLHQACPCKITVDTGGDERPQIYALTQSLPQKVPPGPVPCVGVWQCLVPPHLWLLAAGILVFLVILALLWAWRNSPEPFGYLVDARNERKAIKLGEGQWWTPYRRRSVIEVSDRTIREKFPLLADVPIQFVYHPDQKGREQAYARLKKHGAQTSVCIKNSSHAVSLSREKSEAVLEHGSEIQVNGRPIVIFQTREPAVLHRRRIR